MTSTGRPRRRGAPRLFLVVGLATIVLSGVLGFLIWEMRPLSMRSDAEQQLYRQHVHRRMSQTDVPYRQRAELPHFGINGWVIAPPVYPYVVALDLIAILAGLGLAGYGARRLARERQARQAPPA